MSLDENWFSEPAQGHAISLESNQKLHEEKSPYQTIAIYDTKTFGRLMTLDGLSMLTTRDNFIYHEMMSHPAMYNHPNPKDVAIVGGGDCGTLKEVLKHETVKQITQVELDERVTRISEEYFPELCASNSDPRATLVFEDPMNWIQRAEPDSLDVIIVDRVGPAKQLFQESFYRDCLSVLREGGMVVAQSKSPLLDLGIIVDLRTEMQKADYVEIQTIQFPVATYASGWWTATMARKGQKFGDFREQMARHKPFDTKYYNADIHKACSALPQFMQDVF
ncbi:MAG: polyamine aminopropyltransferase [marine bacterium B5-7]|nr:MAG: polyamine aminopropyltransferase [marine bacterium B5-7]